jgi:methionyl-tRNA formyltransferase
LKIFFTSLLAKGDFFYLNLFITYLTIDFAFLFYYKSKINMKIAFFSSSNFALPIAKKLLELGFLKLIVSAPEKTNRGKIVKNPILEFAQLNSIKTFEPENINLQLADELNDIDLVITASYGQFLGKKLLSKTKFGFLNWHPSKLPLYRGASPIQSSILNGDKITGLSWIDMTKDMDAGVIYLQQEIPIYSNDNFTTISNKLGHLGSLTVEKAIENKVQSISAIQDETKATFCSKIDKYSSLVDHQELTAEQINNHFRAYIEYPFTFIQDTKFGKIKILDCKIKEDLDEEVVAENIMMIGNWLINKKGEKNKKQKVYLRCANRSLLEVSKIQSDKGKNIDFQGYNF